MDGTTYFAALGDPRTGNAKQYPLDEILLTAFATLLTGGETCTDMAGFGEVHLDWLRELRPFDHDAPSHDTFSRVLALLDAEQFESWFTGYMCQAGQSHLKFRV